jgi:ABC-2 type transport system permease protein
LFKLIGNENLKIYGRLRTWILLAIIAAAMLLGAWVIHSRQHTDVNWKQHLTTQTASMQMELAKSKAHMPAAAVKAEQQQILKNEYFIAHNINPSQDTAWTFAMSGQNFSALLIAFIAVIAGDIVAGEFAGGTIKMLLTQTVTRSQILLSKYLATLLYALFMTTCMLGLSIVFGGLFFGFSGVGTQTFYVNTGGTISQMSFGLKLLMDYGFLAIQILMITTIAFMVSTIFRSSALAITLSILAYFVGSTLVGVLSSFSWVKYVLFANTNLEQYFVGGPVIHGMTLGFSIAMLAIYFVIMTLLSWTVFAKRDVAFT